MESDGVLEIKTSNEYEVLTSEKLMNVSKELDIELRTDNVEELKELINYYRNIQKSETKKISIINKISLSVSSTLISVKSKMEESEEKNVDIDFKIIFDSLNNKYDFSTMDKDIISDLIDEFNKSEMYELSNYLNQYLNK